MKGLFEIQKSVDFAIITVRSDEYRCVLAHFTGHETVSGRRYYEYSRVKTAPGGEAGVVIVRCLEQGHGSAHDVTRDVIEDLDPGWILLVGIAGGLPSDDYSLGDVLLASRIYDHSVSAEIQEREEHTREWSCPLEMRAYHTVVRVA